MTTRRALLRFLGIAPVAVIAAKVGIEATPASTGVVRFPNDTVLAYRNAATASSLGIISRETALEQLGMSIHEMEHEMSHAFNDYFINGTPLPK